MSQPTPPANLMSQPLPPTGLMSESHSVTALPPPPPFSTPPKLVPIEQVMKDYPGSNVATLQRLTTALACEAIFGKEEMCKSTLSGRNKTGGLNKVDYIKAVVKSRVPNMPEVHFEAIWTQCRGSLPKSCQILHTATKKIF